MSFALPTSSSPLRQWFDVAELAVMLAPENRQSLPTFRQSLKSAKSFFAAEPTAKALHCVTVRADGEVCLVRVGPRGGWRKLWTFGTL